MPESIEKQAGAAPENTALTAASDAAAFVAQIFQDDQTAAATDAADAQADLPLAAVQWPPVPAGWPQDAAQHLRNPGASAVIYGGMEAQGIVFDGVDEALAVPGTDLRLFGKPESFAKRRMGVALARAGDVDTARSNAKLAAGKVKPRKV